MQFALENRKGLERQLNVTLPAEDVERKQTERIAEVAKKANIKGFRPGKVPTSVVKSLYGDGIRAEIIDELVRQSLTEAIKKEDLHPAGTPHVDITKNEPKENLEYQAKFEVYPEIKLVDSSKIKAEHLKGSVTEADIQKSLEDLLKQHAEWSEVDRPVKEGDRIEIDFEATIKKELLPNGKGEKVEIDLGNDSILPGFDKKMVGAKSGDELKFKLKLPKDLDNKDLAGKTADFVVTLHRVLEGQLPELNDAFAEKLGVSEGGVDAVKEKIKAQMEKGLENAEHQHLRKQVLDQLVKLNKVELPRVLIDQEIDQMKAQFESQKTANPEPSPGEFDAAKAEEEAQRRVTLGLLFSELIEHYSVEVDDSKVNDRIEEIAASYGAQAHLFADWYRQDKARMGEIQSMVMERQIIDKILAEASVKEKKVDYQTAMRGGEKK